MCVLVYSGLDSNKGRLASCLKHSLAGLLLIPHYVRRCTRLLLYVSSTFLLVDLAMLAFAVRSYSYLASAGVLAPVRATHKPVGVFNKARNA
jgi:hypothetical protein